MIFNFALVFLGLFKLLSSAKATKSTPKNASSEHSPSQPPQPPQKARQVAPIAQMDFLVTPDDFNRDEDVNYLVNLLHRPQSIEKFYRSAAQIYDDLAVAYQEIQAGAKVAEQFLDIMKRLTAASLNEPLTVTNLIFAASKHLRPLFIHKSPPIEEMYATISKLELDKSRKMIWLMTQFFLSFTLREVPQIQDFIRLASLATLNTEQPETPAPLKPVKKSTVKTTAIKTKTGKLDISRTSLDSYAERIRITISNALAKMIILLDLFVTDPTVITRSINLINRLWTLHLRRLAQRENIPFEELDDKWKDPILYRKSAINFSFDDWSPDSVSAESMAALRKAAETADRRDKAFLAHRKSSNVLPRAIWGTLSLLFISCSIAFVYFYLKRRQFLLQQQQKIDLTSFESQSINDIVSNLESNIE